MKRPVHMVKRDQKKESVRALSGIKAKDIGRGTL